MRMRGAIAQLPDGEYAFSDVMDDDGAGTEDIRINLVIHKSGERMVFDFEGTDPQVPGNFNLTLNRSEEHTSELQSLMRISYAVFCLKKKKHTLESIKKE